MFTVAMIDDHFVRLYADSVLNQIIVFQQFDLVHTTPGPRILTEMRVRLEQCANYCVSQSLGRRWVECCYLLREIDALLP